MNRTELLEKAKERVMQKSDYGSPENHFTKIAEYWSVYLECGIDAEDVINMMILLKIARNGASIKEDTLIDIAGYAACGAEVMF